MKHLTRLTKRSGATFEYWKGKVNEVIERKVGIDADGLPDWDYQNGYESNMTPTAAAMAVIRAAKNH